MTQREPKNGFWLLYLGWAQAAKGDPAAAVKSFDAALAADPKVKLPVLYARGKAKLQLVDLDGREGRLRGGARAREGSHRRAGRARRDAAGRAVVAARSGSARDPRTQGHRRPAIRARSCRRGRSRQMSRASAGGSMSRASAITRRSSSRSSTSPALVGLARVELRDDKLAVAADLVAEGARARRRTIVDAQLVAADLYITQGKLDDAFAITQKLAARTPPLPPPQRAQLDARHRQRARGAGQGRRRDRGLDRGCQARRRHRSRADDDAPSPSSASSRRRRPTTRTTRRPPTTARAPISCCRRSPIARRTMPQLSKALGVAYLGADDPAKAEHFLRRAVEMKGDDIETHLELAKALSKLQAHDDALEQLKAAQQTRSVARRYRARDRAHVRGRERPRRRGDGRVPEAARAKDPPVQARVRAGRFLARKGDIKTAAAQGDPILAGRAGQRRRPLPARARA